MTILNSIEALEAVYGKEMNPRSLQKVQSMLTPSYRAWIETARFAVMATVGPEGIDVSPRGEDGSAVRIEDAQTLMMPDWSGNNRLDSLRNIVRDPRVSLMFMNPHHAEVLRVIGKAQISVDPKLCQSFEMKQMVPKSVIIFKIDEVYPQCAKSILRSKLWDAEVHAQAPSMAEMLKECE